MKFCLISENYINEAIGGAEVQCNYIAQELLKRNYEVYYIYQSTKKKKMFIEKGIVFKPIYIPKIFKKILSHIIPVKLVVEYILLNRTMKAIRADYWYHRSVNTFLVSLVNIKNKIGGKLIYALSMDMQAKKRGWISRYGRFYHNKFEKSLSLVDYFIFQKESQKSAFLKEYSHDGIVIYNGHPNDPIVKKEKRIELKVKPMKIIWVGNLKKMKQPGLYLEIVSKMRHFDIEFHMVGKSSSDYENIILEMSKKIKNFYYHGQLKNIEVLKMFSTSSLNVSTSSSEGFPNVFIESWKFGVPVISFINPDGLFDKYNVGFVCKDINEMIEKINFLLNSPELYQKMSSNSIKLFNEYFSIKNNVSTMLKFVTNEVNN